MFFWPSPPSSLRRTLSNSINLFPERRSLVSRDRIHTLGYILTSASSVDKPNENDSREGISHWSSQKCSILVFVRSLLGHGGGGGGYIILTRSQN
ncbi:hypothetical protein B0H10DRAFT_8306 [Mycena sp. CBHHK59/15]|nr:hypothetical protein B0H10DRAFT_8306 [Mycena sp. CBHHK59/15]